MPSLKDIRRRIGSVQNTEKITAAMKLVAAAKLRRAQESILQARPYAVRLADLIRDLAAQADESEHPLLATRPPQRVVLVVFTSDRGLCGSFNSIVLRATESYLRENRDKYREIRLVVVGRKGREYLKFRGHEIATYFPGIEVAHALDSAREISGKIVSEYVDAELDQVQLLYNEFRSAMSQRLVVPQLLPIKASEVNAQGEWETDPTVRPPASAVEFAYEPNRAQILSDILPMYVQVQIYRAVLESIASEYGARMTAMDNASKNAEEMISTLTLEYNKARQAAITRELLEIVAGAEALRG